MCQDPQIANPEVFMIKYQKRKSATISKTALKFVFLRQFFYFVQIWNRAFICYISVGEKVWICGIGSLKFEKAWIRKCTNYKYENNKKKHSVRKSEIRKVQHFWKIRKSNNLHKSGNLRIIAICRTCLRTAHLCKLAGILPKGKKIFCMICCLWLTQHKW